MNQNYFRDTRWEEHCDKIHKEKLKSMKHIVKDDSPPTYPHLDTKAKKIQLTKGSI